jgi:dipeptidyl aminopeptidase/acylaminoacyl peptidase
MTAADHAVPEWEARYRAARVTLPDWATDAPHRSLYQSNATGTYEFYAWDRETGTTRQVTDRPNGTSMGAVDPSGEWIWWFADTDGDEYGVWMRQPFGGGTDGPAVRGLEKSYSAGLALGRDGQAVVGQSDDAYGTRIWRSTPGHDPVLLYAHAESASVGDLSRDGSLVAIEHSEHGDSRHPALRVLKADGTIVGELWDGPGKGLEILGFAPVAGDTRVLVQHERRGRPELLVWDVATGAQQELLVDLPGELAGEWFPDANAVLVEHAHAARSELYRLDPVSGALQRVESPPGVVGDATARPDGTVEYSWSSSEQPPAILSSDRSTVLVPPGPAAPPSVPVQDVWVDGPGGHIHVLLSRPAGDPPYPTLFLVHGGPTWQDYDAFAPDVAAWVDHGVAVVRVNYRGSTGYGSAWRDALEGRVGLTELEDIEAVRNHVVAAGLADPERLVLAGGSWGGFLTLLGLGRQPELWSLGIAMVPVADYLAAYEDEMEGLKAFDRSLFGGSPEEVPERYVESSPITYVDEAIAPVLVLAGENDPRCPIRQIDNYLARLAARGAAHEVYRFDAGHGSLVVEERIRQLRAELDFVMRRLVL